MGLFTKKKKNVMVEGSHTVTTSTTISKEKGIAFSHDCLWATITLSK